ncbi:HupE / UreJ protein [Jannaschia pohangensis]|uniref:HupE / UreJ protein n=2 Tax=Jannaschia pohangensis TaxID=390807 RepID=A0A1I3TKY6_9RHOB|nr:HupE / UreJ protein [Jannaschia pohangensis]
MVGAVTVSAHEVQPSVSDVIITESEVTITLTTAIEPLIAGLNLDEITDTNDSPLAGFHDRLRALPPAELSTALTEAWPGIAEQITLRAGDTDLPIVLGEIDIPDVGDVEVRRDSSLTLTADLPDDGTPVVFGWDASLGGLIVRQGDGESSYDAYLTGGAMTDAMPREGVAEQTLGQVIARYVVSGFDHIIPKGLDHILFVLGLFFYALAWRPMLWQVTAFTAAHTVTLALATLGYVQPTMWIIETLIALSIVWIAVENVIGGPKKEIGWPRIAVVFGFGLLHGLGFASVLSEFGLGQHFVASLISFNIGVEIGQLAVIATAFLLLGLPFGSKPFYRKAIVIPGSLIIAAIGTYWVFNRIGLVGDLPYLT